MSDEKLIHQRLLEGVKLISSILSVCEGSCIAIIIPALKSVMELTVDEIGKDFTMEESNSQKREIYLKLSREFLEKSKEYKTQ